MYVYDGFSFDREALRKQMSMRGFVYDRLKASHDHHMEAIEDITNSFKEHNIQVNVVPANQLSHEAIEGVDMVFSAGGDGTFLKVHHHFLPSHFIHVLD